MTAPGRVGEGGRRADETSPPGSARHPLNPGPAPLPEDRRAAAPACPPRSRPWPMPALPAPRVGVAEVVAFNNRRRPVSPGSRDPGRRVRRARSGGPDAGPLPGGGSSPRGLIARRAKRIFAPPPPHIAIIRCRCGREEEAENGMALRSGRAGHSDAELIAAAAEPRDARK